MSLPLHHSDSQTPPEKPFLHVVASLDPEAGGVAEGVRQLVDATLGLGHPVEIATLDPPGSPWAGRFTCPLHELGPTRLGTYRYTGRMKTWLDANADRYSAVIVHGLWQYHGLATRLALRKTRTPYFVFTHGMLDPWFKHTYPLKHLKKWLYWPWGEYRVLRDARAVLFTCEEERLLARQSFGLYTVREAVVSFGTQGPVAQDASWQTEMFFQRFPQLRGKRLILFLGRIHPKKGCDLLIEAFASASRIDPELHLVMAGPDQAGIQPALVARAQALGITALTWTGMLQGDTKWGALRAAEVFVLPSHQENFGIAVVEALACRTPVLISDKVNIWREIQEDGSGLVEPDTLTGTQALLERWLALDPNGRQEMRDAAIASFTRRFHIEVAAENLLHLLGRTDDTDAA